MVLLLYDKDKWIPLNMTSFPLYWTIFAVSATTILVCIPPKQDSVTHVCQEKAKVSLAAIEGETTAKWELWVRCLARFFD